MSCYFWLETGESYCIYSRFIKIEYNTGVLKSAGWLTDPGPEAGDDGGYLEYAGKPEGLKNVKESHTEELFNSKPITSLKPYRVLH